MDDEDSVAWEIEVWDDRPTGNPRIDTDRLRVRITADLKPDLAAQIASLIATGEVDTVDELIELAIADYLERRRLPIGPRLSVQEERALVLFASGMTTRDVARIMNVMPSTAKQYIDRVKAKYTASGITARSKHDLTRIAWAEGYATPTLPTADTDD